MLHSQLNPPMGFQPIASGVMSNMTLGQRPLPSVPTLVNQRELFFPKFHPSEDLEHPIPHYYPPHLRIVPPTLPQHQRSLSAANTMPATQPMILPDQQLAMELPQLNGTQNTIPQFQMGLIPLTAQMPQMGQIPQMVQMGQVKEVGSRGKMPVMGEVSETGQMQMLGVGEIPGIGEMRQPEMAEEADNTDEMSEMDSLFDSKFEEEVSSMTETPGSDSMLDGESDEDFTKRMELEFHEAAKQAS
jgi:hypothetical protein